MDISVAWFNGVRDTVPSMVVTTWDEFAETLEVASQGERSVSEKLNSPLISPALYAQGAHRNNANVQGFGGWFAIDIDDAPGSLQDASKLCIEANVNHVIWTTTSHTQASPRFRVAFPLDRFVRADEMAQFWMGTNIWFKEWGDAKTKDPSRMMIAPAHWQGTTPQFIRVDGLDTMSVDRLLALCPVAPAPVAVAPAAPKLRAPVNGSVATSPEHARALLAISKWNLGTLMKADLQGVKAKHLMPPPCKAQKHGRGGAKLAAAKRTLERLKRAAK
ncbi:hypothetical protein WEU32_02270 [Brevundimonas sp. BH3]|uniref:hypothetical protein n=1 Tax=Brevundimonas sp. BH3 TaxID=3133089 RepID=UPI003252D69E